MHVFILTGGVGNFVEMFRLLLLHQKSSQLISL